MHARIDQYLRELTAYPDRHVGGPGNKAATAMFAQRMAELGLSVTRRSFDCIEWEYGAATLEIEGVTIAAHVGPYSLPCDVVAPLVIANCVEQLETEAIRGKVALLYGDLAGSQIMPKSFTFYNPDEHKRIIHAIEQHAPAAIIAATGSNPEMVSSQYPFPLFEDGDFDIPNAYMKAIDGERILPFAGRTVQLRIDSRRIATTAEQIVATLPGSGTGRIVVSAHIDSHKGSPGALDNASGVAALLCLADLLSSYSGVPSIEFVPFNGEDNYANPGEMLWIAENEGRWGDIMLGINIDDLGMRGTQNHISFYECPPAIEATIRAAIPQHETISEGPPWFQSDHAIFSMNGCPAIAITSSDIAGFMSKYAHTERDTLELADPQLIADGVHFLHEVILRLGTYGQ